MYCDMHGHSRKRNVFMYGCASNQTEVNHHKNNNLIKVMPYLMSQKNKLFSYSDCKFQNEKDKEGRVGDKDAAAWNTVLRVLQMLQSCLKIAGSERVHRGNLCLCAAKERSGTIRRESL